MAQAASDCPECGEQYESNAFQFVDPPAETDEMDQDEYWLCNKLNSHAIRRLWACAHCGTKTESIEISLNTLFDLVADSASKLEDIEQYFPSKPGKGLSQQSRFDAPELFIPDGALAAIVGNGSFSRNEIVERVWAYIRKNGLQDKLNKRYINSDDALARVFGTQKVSMFEMGDLIFGHVSSV